LRLFPESITSAVDGRLLIGSIAHREILEVTPGAAAAGPFIAADTETSLGVYGVFADDKSGTLWACFSSFPGAQAAAQAASAVTCPIRTTCKSTA
jgi:hypothetical protein